MAAASLPWSELRPQGFSHNIGHPRIGKLGDAVEMRVAGRGDEDPVQTTGTQHRGEVAMRRQPGRRDARPCRFHRIGDGDDPKDVAAGKRAQMGLPHAPCPHEAHAEDRHRSGLFHKAGARGRGIGRIRQRPAGKMGVDDGLAERDVAQRVLARGDGRAPAGDAVVEVDQLFLEALGIGDDLLVAPGLGEKRDPRLRP